MLPPDCLLARHRVALLASIQKASTARPLHEPARAGIVPLMLTSPARPGSRLAMLPLKALWLLFLGVISKYSSWTILVPIKFVIQPLHRCGRGQRHDTFLRFWKFKRSGTRMFGRYFEVFFADYTL